MGEHNSHSEENGNGAQRDFRRWFLALILALVTAVIGLGAKDHDALTKLESRFDTLQMQYNTSIQQHGIYESRLDRLEQENLKHGWFKDPPRD